MESVDQTDTKGEQESVQAHTKEESNKEELNKHFEVPIVELNKNGVIINRWNRIQGAARKFHLANDSVLKACKESPHILKGHILRFAKDVDSKKANEIKSVLKKIPKKQIELTRKKSVSFEGIKQIHYRCSQVISAAS